MLTLFAIIKQSLISLDTGETNDRTKQGRRMTEDQTTQEAWSILHEALIYANYEGMHACIDGEKA